MEITHLDGAKVNTDKLGDVDALLMEESAKLHKLFVQYNRQLLLVGEMKGLENNKTDAKFGTSFFHIAPLDSTQEVQIKQFTKYISRIHWLIYTISRGSLGIGKMPEPLD
jgi:hypothetical protein